MSRPTLLGALAIALLVGCDTPSSPRSSTFLAARFSGREPPPPVQRALVAVLVDGRLRDTFDLAYRSGAELSLGTVPFGSSFEVALVGYDSGSNARVARWAAKSSGRAESSTGTQVVEFALQIPAAPEVSATGSASTDTLLLPDSVWAADGRDPARAPRGARYRLGGRAPVPVSGRLVFVRDEPSRSTPEALRASWTDFDTLWSDTISMTFRDPTGSVVAGNLLDARDGRSYRTLTWLGRSWMAENLAWAGPSGATGLCPELSADSCARYGRLYTWKEAMASAPSSEGSPSGVVGICPDGWHLPSPAEWDDLAGLLGGRSVAADSLRLPSGWPPGASGRDAVGFSALPAGQGYASDSTFAGRGTDAFWWSTAAVSSSEATRFQIAAGEKPLYASAGYTTGPFTQMASVRCTRN